MVEVIVDEAVLKKKKAQPPGNKLVMIRVYQHERYVQKMIKSVGACWNPQCGLWGRYRIGRLSLWVWKAGWNRKVVMLSDVLYREFIYTL
ncbi:hypothetical protein JXO52_03035 [bacterium]|nr:hypothetical protein [bacterium]